jgi:hypothetical protein
MTENGPQEPMPNPDGYLYDATGARVSDSLQSTDARYEKGTVEERQAAIQGLREQLQVIVAELESESASYANPASEIKRLRGQATIIADLLSGNRQRYENWKETGQSV